MPRRISPWVFILPVVLIGLVIIVRVSGWPRMSDGIGRLIASSGSSLYSRVGVVRRSVDAIVHFRTIAQDNERFQREVQDLSTRLAQLETTSQENEALRKMLALPIRYAKPPVEAHIFAQSLVEPESVILLNQGSQAGVSDGQVVITPQGALVGVVEATGVHTSRVRPVYDFTFSVTAKVRGGNTIGIAKGAGPAGLNFDLIVQTDAIAVGDTISTSGDDLFPAGLTVGTVIEVKDSATNVFRKVRIEPALGGLHFGQVFVIQK